MTLNSRIRGLAGAALMTTFGLGAAFAQDAGPSSLQETYQDWQVVCQQVEGKQACSMIQQQFQAQTNQRFLALELRKVDTGLEGALVMPFGLKLSDGVALSVDDKPLAEKLEFRTCLPAGCVVLISFSAEQIAVLTAGQALQIRTVSDGNEELIFSASLKGITSANTRLAALAN